MTASDDTEATLYEQFALAADGIFVKDGNGRYRYINEAGARFFARSVAQVLGQTDETLFATTVYPRIYDVEQKVIETGKPYTVHLRRQHQGENDLFFITQHPYYAANCELLGILGVIRQQTETTPSALNPPPTEDQTERSGKRAASFSLTQFASANLDALKLTRSLLSLQSAATAVASSLNRHHVLDTFCWELTNLLNVNACYVYEWHPETDEIVCIAQYTREEWDGASQDYPTFSLAQRPSAARVIKERYAWQIHADAPGTDWREQQQMARRHITGLLLLPLVFQDQTMGLVELVGHTAMHAFTDQEVSLAQLLTNQAAAAIANARLYEELERRLQELSSLNQISQAVTSTLDIEKTLTLITNHTLSLLGVETAAVVLLDKERQEVWYAAVSGEAVVGIRGKRLSLGQDGVSQAIAHGEILLLSGRVLQEAYFRVFDHNQRFQAHSLLSVPLQAQGEIFGAIQAFNRVDGNKRFTPEDVRLLNSLAAPAAAAIANARLYQQARQEIAERTRVEEQIQSSLAEKEVLLKEIHHRVKNNLQVISSLINLQSDYVSDPKALAVFQESQNRIRSMALIHEKLYRSQNLAYIDLAEYMHDLCVYLFRSYSAAEQGITLNIQIENVYLDINTAVPCGFMLNELVSNALKHAFPNKRQGNVFVSACRLPSQQLQLQIQDDGVGFPAHIDFRNTTSLGLQLVSTLVNQLEGTLTLVRMPTTFTVVFDLPKE